MVLHVEWQQSQTSYHMLFWKVTEHDGQTILTERKWNGDGTKTCSIVWIGPKANRSWSLPL